MAVPVVLVGVSLLVVWARASKLHDRLMARCEGMFERMPDTFPPKRMMRGIEEIRVNTAQILERLEARESDKPQVPGGGAEAVHHVA
jgi:hypothetical protein